MSNQPVTREEYASIGLTSDIEANERILEDNRSAREALKEDAEHGSVASGNGASVASGSGAEYKETVKSPRLPTVEEECEKKVPARRASSVERKSEEQGESAILPLRQALTRAQ